MEEEPPPPSRRAIYPLVTQSGWKVRISPYNDMWPQQFITIQSQLHDILSNSSPPAKYTSIEHIGSTSIPGLCAKANIDILITLPSQTELDHALEAFAWEVPSHPPYIKYSLIPNGGGIQGRESLKLYIPSWSPYYTATDTSTTIPERSVYLVNENRNENPAGTVHIRCYRDVKKTLSKASNEDLLQEYANVKMELATKIFDNSITYAILKDGVVRKILLRAGWTDDEVDEKERLSRFVVREIEPPY